MLPSTFWGLAPRQRLEFASWRSVAALAAKAYLVGLSESHPMDGHYDVVRADLAAADPRDPPLGVIFNRHGSTHLVRDDNGPQHTTDVMGAVAGGMPAEEAVDGLLALLTVPALAPAPARGTPCSVMARLLEFALDIGGQFVWEWRCEVSDAGTGIDRDRLRWFGDVPSASWLRDEGGPARLPGHVWFLLRSGEPVLAVDLAGSGNLLVGDRAVPALRASSVLAAERHIARTVKRLTKPARRGIVEPLRAAFAARAVDLAAGVVGADVQPFTPGRRLSAFAEWFVGPDDSLILVMGPQESPKDAVAVLAFALAWQRDRDVLLVLPGGFAGPVARLLPWIRTPVRVYAYDLPGSPAWAQQGPVPLVVPSRVEVLAEARQLPLRTVDDHDLGGWVAHVGALLDQVRNRVGLVEQTRPGYTAWHAGGRQVLQLATTAADRLKIIAGVNYGQPGPLTPAPYTVELDAGPVSEAVSAAVLAALDDALLRRGTGEKDPDREHRLQSVLGENELPGIPSVAYRREYPSWRGPYRPGFVDFLAVDKRGRQVVVETKVGADVSLALQALEYSIWVAAWSTELAGRHGWVAPAGTGSLRFDLLVAGKRPGAPAYDAYLFGVLEALSGDVAWRVLHADGLGPSCPDVVELRRGDLRSGLHGVEPVQPPRWAGRTHAALTNAAGMPGHLWRQPTSDAALLPEARSAYDELNGRRLLHRFSLHVRSSQTFALNLFAPLDDDGLRGLWAAMGTTGLASVEPPAYEYSGPDGTDLLGERRKSSAHQTQVDVLLRAQDEVGRRLGVLVEVKLSEDDFGHCSAYDSAANPARSVCRSPGLFGGEAERCFQLVQAGAGKSRAYARLLGDWKIPEPHTTDGPPPRRDDGGCWVRGSRSQPMRNLALGQALLDQGVVDQVGWALCAPSGHQAMWRRFDEVRDVFGAHGEVALHRLSADAVAGLHPDGGTALRMRYPILC